MRASAALGIAGCVWLVLAGCNRETRGDEVREVSAARADGESAGELGTLSVPMSAQAELSAAEGATIDGSARLFQEPDGVRVVVEVTGAPPGKKGVFVHTRGDCSDMKKQSMGPHLAPKLERHALPSEGADRHLGDLGNISVAGDGKGRLEIKVANATLGADESTSFLGRALVVHSAEDTGSGAQPAGDSGAPIACGIIRERG